MKRKQAQNEATEMTRTRSTPPPMHAGSSSLQATAGNRAVTGLVQRWRDQVLQRAFDHQGKKRKATTYRKNDALPKIQGVSATDLRLLADDEHNYGPIENKQDFDLAWVAYQQRHTKQAEVVPLEESQTGNVTVLDLEDVEQNQFAGTVRVTFQLDWLQGKHDQPFMKDHSTEKPRTSADNQMRLSLARYHDLADGAPKALAQARLAAIFAKPERTALHFMVMDTKQSDDLYYEISAEWATTGPSARHVLVYYHCFPDKEDQKKFGFSK